MVRVAFKQCTVFAIAHRLDTIIDYDRIVCEKKQNRDFVRPLFEFKVLKTIILPRQARDKCRNNLQILPVFLTGRPRPRQPHRAREWR
jgi:hypothetical protein